MLPKFFLNLLAMMMTSPSPGRTVALLMISMLMPNPRIAEPKMQRKTCSA